MSSASAVNLTLVLYPSSPRDLIFHILQKGQDDAEENNTKGILRSEPPGAIEPEPRVLADAGESDDESDGDGDTGGEPQSNADGSPVKKRKRRTKAEIEADRLAQSTGNITLKPGISDSLPSVAGVSNPRQLSSLDSPSPVNPTPPPAPPHTPTPEKETPRPTPPLSPEHGEPVAPVAPGVTSPSELPLTAQKTQNLEPYMHANPEHRRALMHVINSATGMAFAQWKNNETIYGVVRKFQADLEGKPALIVGFDPATLSPWVGDKLRDALAPVLPQKAEETF